MKIALVEPPRCSPGGCREESYAHAIPLALLTLHACIDRRHSISVINMNVTGDRARLMAERFDVVGIRCLSVDCDYVIRLSRRLKGSYRPVVIAGGHHPSLAPGDLLRCGSIDYVVRGSAERAFSALIERLEKGKRVDDIQGVCYREGNEIHREGMATVDDLDRMPMPSYEAVDIDAYVRVNGGTVPYEVSRGCRYRCSYCSLWKVHPRLSFKSVGRVAADIERIVKLSPRVRKIRFEGYLGASKERLVDFARAIGHVSRRSGRDLTWIAGIEPANADPSLIRHFKAHGLVEAHVKLDTIHPESLRRLRHDQTLKATLHVVELLRENAIRTRVSFQVGFPWETAEEMRETIAYAIRLEQRGVLTSLYRCTPFPGTDVAAMVKLKKRSSRSSFTINPLWEGGELSFEHPHVSDREVRRMVEYYFKHKMLSFALSCHRQSRRP